MNRRDASYVYLAAFVVVGLSLTIAGPAIGLLEGQTGSSTAAIGLVFTMQGAGYLIGALAFGHAYDRGSGNRVMALALVVVAAGVLWLPRPDDLAALCLAFVVVGIGAAVVDVGGNTLLGWAHPERAGSWLAALHFCFGVGALASPLIVALSDNARGDIGLAAAIVAALALAAAARVAWMPVPTRPPVPQSSESERRMPRGTGFVAVFLFLYVGVELGFGGWVHTYADEIGFGSAGATGLTAAFWAAFTVGRLLAIGLARRMSSARMLTGSCIIASAALGALTLGGVLVDGAPVAFAWPATILLGIGVAPQFPMAIAFATEHLHLTGRTMSAFVAAAGASGLVMPWAIGQALDARGPRAVPVAVLLGSLVVLGWWLFTERRVLEIGRSARLREAEVDA